MSIAKASSVFALTKLFWILLFLTCIISFVLLPFYGLGSSWRINTGNVELLHAQDILSQPGAANVSAGTTQSGFMSLYYLDLAERSIKHSDLRAAESFWKSALTQGDYKSGDFLMRYRAFWIGRQLEGLDTDSILGMGKFKIDSIIESLGPGVWPPDLHQVVAVAGRQEWVSPQLYIYLIDSFIHAGDYQTALGTLSAVAEQQPEAAWVYFKMGQLQEIRAIAEPNIPHLLESSLAFYKQTYELVTDQPFAVDRLVQINQRLGKHSQAQEWQGVLVHQLARRQPEYLVDQRVNEKWRLIGYDLQEELLGLAGTGYTPICLWWSYIGKHDIPVVDGYWLPDGTVVQCYRIVNLVHNGGFELESETGAKFPMGFESDWYEGDYDVPLGVHHISPDPLGERLGNVAWLSNTVNARNSSFQSDLIKINENSAYLQAAYVRTLNGGTAYVGHLWLRDGYYFNGYNYVGSGNPGKWTHWAGVAVPPSGTIAAKVWLLNHESEGEVYFDDVLFARIRFP